jgi:hypothetical protein
MLWVIFTIIIAIWFVALVAGGLGGLLHSILASRNESQTR